jgi:hypothetical protein
LSVERSVFRVVASDGETLGTAFKIAPSKLITCHHVVASHGAIEVVDPDGVRLSVSIIEDEALADFDLILLGLRVDAGEILPSYGGAVQISHFRTVGFQFGEKGVRAAFPSVGTVDGVTDVQYRVSRSYLLHQIYVLGSTNIDGGTSGAPLIEQSSGVAVGIVVARMDARHSGVGYAIPFSGVARLDSVAQALAENEVTPRFGRFLNAAGFQKLVENQIQKAHTRLQAEKLFNYSRFVLRPELEAELDAFARNEGKFRLIIGPSGNGKTAQLAHWARKGTRLLLRFVDVSSSDRHVGETILSALNRTAVGLQQPEIPDLSSLVRFVSEIGAPIIIIDGLNEIQARLSNAFVSWWNETCQWVAEANVRVAISTRPETWEVARRRVPQGWLKSPTDDQLSPVEVGEFSFGEALSFCRENQLDESLVLDRHLRNPLLLCLAAELRVSNSADFSTLVDAWIDNKCAETSLLLGGRVTKARLIAGLQEVAARMWLNGRSWITRGDYSESFYGYLEAGDLFVTNNLMSESSEGLRFSFDAAAEWLISRSVSTDTLLSDKFWHDHDWDPIVLGAVREHVMQLWKAGSGEVAKGVIAKLYPRRASNTRCNSCSSRFLARTPILIASSNI